jgi:hypothetical protein
MQGLKITLAVAVLAAGSAVGFSGAISSSPTPPTPEEDSAGPTHRRSAPTAVLYRRTLTPDHS